MDAFYTLPREIILGHIISRLELAEMCTLKQVSYRWKELVEDYFSQLKQLDVTDSKHILTEPGFSSIVLHLKRLNEICLDGCWVVASPTNLFSLFKNCPHLKIFSAKRCKYIDDGVLMELATRCNNLEILNIDFCFQVTNSGIIYIFRQCRKLRIFSCNKNYGFTDSGAEIISTIGSNLEELDIGFCLFVTDAGLNHVLKNSSKLSYLRITGCSKVVFSPPSSHSLLPRGVQVIAVLSLTKSSASFGTLPLPFLSCLLDAATVAQDAAQVSEQMVKRFVEKGIVVNNCY